MGISAQDVRDCLGSNVLQLILMPTEACNFRCVYCWEEFRYSRMAASVVAWVKDFLTRRASDLEVLTLSWFGGEPLLARDIVEDILAHAQVLMREHPQIRFSSDISTNAYFLELPLFERLLELGVTQYLIAFDGPREWHDKKRVLANGRGTFDRIWENVMAMRSVRRQFTVLVRLHADKENYSALPEFIEGYRQAFGEDSRFKLYLTTLARLGGANDSKLSVFEGQEQKGAINALSHKVEQEGVAYITDLDIAPVCFASRANSFVVRADGRLNKCILALEHPMNQVGHISQYGCMDLNASKMRMWIRGLESGSPKELECPMRGFADEVAKIVPVTALTSVVGGVSAK